MNTQASHVDIEYPGPDQVAQKGKKGAKKKQWDPVILLRRSTRNIDDGKTI